MKTLQLTGFSAAGPPAAPGARPTPTRRHQVAEALRVLHRMSPALSGAGWLHVGLGALALGLLPLDHRHVAGAGLAQAAQILRLRYYLPLASLPNASATHLISL